MKTFNTPVIEIEKFEMEDVITVSGGPIVDEDELPGDRS